MKNFIYFVIIVLSLFSPSLYSQVYHWVPLNSGTTNHLNAVSGNIIVGSGGIILKSGDSGFNWSVVPSGTTSDLKSVYVYSSLVFVSGTNGTVLKSTNSGDNWSVISTGVTNTLNAISRSTSTQYFAAGTGGKILYSSNTGLNWISQNSGVSTDLNSIYTIALLGWAVGNNGVYLKTTNYGTSWTQQSLGVTTNLNYIYFSSAAFGWIVGDNGKIFNTTDGGNNWTSVNSGTAANLRSYSQPGWIAGDGGIVLRSTNTGINWSLQNVGPNIDWNSVYSSGLETGWLAGKNGKLYQRRYDSLYAPWKVFAPNNISTFILNSGVFNQDKRTYNTPGFQWPFGTGKYAIFSSGLTIAAKYNGVLRNASASYQGEYTPGYIADSSGISVARTDSRFRIYSVKRGDNASTNQNWAEWGQMVPFGAPYVDVNANHQYEPAIDTPGIKGASQTIFICMTDGFASTHKPGEGFGGGTLPLYAEVHLTAWGFNTIQGLNDVQFLSWDVINKSKVQWQSTYFSFYSDVDLGNSQDDYIGCDTTRNLGYCYNGDDDDEQSGNNYNYGLHPPAVGMMFLNCIPGYASLSSFGFTLCNSCPAPPCENEAWNPDDAYNYMKGYKKNGVPWFIPITTPPQRTKFNFSGEPESGLGWDAGDGRITNCDTVPSPFYPPQKSDQRMAVNYGAENKNLNPNDTQKILIAQLIARGSTNLNSVTRLKLLSDTVKMMCNNGVVFGVKEISSHLPSSYKLYQNYPNPFNPVTKIRFDVSPNLKSEKSNVKLVVYDILGKEIEMLFNQSFSSGTYEADWDASNYASGIYFYSLLVDGKVIDSKKMLLIK